MNKFIVWGLVCLAFGIAGCDRDDVTAPTVPTSAGDETLAQTYAQELVTAAEWVAEGAELASADKCFLLEFQREVLVDDIVHYSVLLPVGAGPHDVIRLHRVVRETSPLRPLRTGRNVFLQHGCCKDFVGMFVPGLYSDEVPDGWGFAVYLAQHEIDVWGMDQDWAVAEAEVGGSGIMTDWGLERGVNNLRIGTAVTRTARLLSGCGNAKLILAGYSNGVPSTVALLDWEASRPARSRNIGGYMAIDGPIKVVEPGLIATMQGYLDYEYGVLAEGVTEEPNTFPYFAELLACCPDGHDLDPTLTNTQVILAGMCGPGFSPTDMHYWAGVYDGQPVPSALRFTTYDAWFDFMASGNPYEPTIWSIDWLSYAMGILDTPYDDHLGQITVPVLNVTPAGGFGPSLDYGLGLLGSTDVQTFAPAVGGLPLAEEFGHVDLFSSGIAETIAWPQMLAWIRDHTSNH